MADEIHKINSALFEFNLFDDHGDIMARFIICYLLKIKYVKNLEELNAELKKNKNKLKDLLFCILFNIIGPNCDYNSQCAAGDFNKFFDTETVTMTAYLHYFEFNADGPIRRTENVKDVAYDKKEKIYNKLIEGLDRDRDDPGISIIECFRKYEIKTNDQVRYLAEVFIDNIDNIDYKLIRTKLDLDKPPDVKYPPFLRALLAYTGEYACQTHNSDSIELIPLSNDGKSNLNNILKTISYNDIDITEYYSDHKNILAWYNNNKNNNVIAEPNYLQDPSSGINCYDYISGRNDVYKSTLINAINDIIGVKDEERIPYVLGAIKYQNIGFIIKILLGEKINQPQPSVKS